MAGENSTLLGAYMVLMIVWFWWLYVWH